MTRKLIVAAYYGLGDSFSMKVRDVLKALAKDGWIIKNQEGSHRHFVHPTKPGKTTVHGHPSMEVDPKTLKSIWKQAGL